MVKNSGDTQARFLAKSLAVLLAQSVVSDQHPAKEIYRKGREGRKGNTDQEEVAADLRR